MHAVTTEARVKGQKRTLGKLQGTKRHREGKGWRELAEGHKHAHTHTERKRSAERKM